MRILVDGYNLARPTGTGVATYGRNFLSAAAMLGSETGVLFGADRSAEQLERDGFAALMRAWPSPVPGGTKARRIWGGLRALGGFDISRLPTLESDPLALGTLPSRTEIWHAFALFASAIGSFRKLGHFTTLRNPGFDVAHWTYPLPLRLEGAINVYTFHDLVPLVHNELTLDDPAKYQRLCEAVLAHADHVLTVSDASKSDLVSVLGADPAHITTTWQPHGIDRAVCAQAEAGVAQTLGELGLTRGGYLLFFGAIEPKKNVRRLLEAYYASGCRTPLVIAGSKAWLADDQLAPWARHADAGMRERVRLIGYQPRGKLLALVRGARAALFPSITEGFGLPAIEAMALGVPVMASSAGGLGEVVGDAALVIDPFDTRAMAAGIARIDRDPELRARLVTLGERQARRFDADVYRERLAGVLDRLKQTGPRAPLNSSSRNRAAEKRD